MKEKISEMTIGYLDTLVKNRDEWINFSEFEDEYIDLFNVLEKIGIKLELKMVENPYEVLIGVKKEMERNVSPYKNRNQILDTKVEKDDLEEREFKAVSKKFNQKGITMNLINNLVSKSPININIFEVKKLTDLQKRKTISYLRVNKLTKNQTPKPSLNGEITLTVDIKNMLVQRNDNGAEYKFVSKSGKSKRFDYFCKILKDKKVPADKFKKSFQLISGEIKKINEAICEKLHLTEYIILNKMNSGYEINPVYKITTI